MKKRKDGYYRISRTIDGKVYYFYGKTQAEAKRKCNSFEVHRSSIPFKEAAEQWFEHHSASLAFNTVRGYIPSYERAVDTFGDINLTEITPLDISKYIRQMADLNYSDKTVRTQLGVISMIFQYACKIVKKGSSLPGSIASKIDNNLIYKFKLPKTVIAVTGSSGKGSTTKLIYDVYKNLGFTVAYNSSGSNLKDGILTTLIENSNLFGKIKKDILLVEMDERYAKYVFPAIKPNYVVITNITRDQPPRQGNFDLVFTEIQKAITPDMHLILNADDPYLQKFVIGKKNQVTYYGVEKNKYSTNKNKFENLNLIYCPKCNKKLVYDFYHFENIGSYKCNNCEISRPNCNYSVRKIDYENNIITLNDGIKLKIPFGMLYAAYNTLAAFTTLVVNNLETKKIEESINNIISTNHSMNCFDYDNRLIYTLNNKNENSTTFNQSLLFMDRDQQPKSIIIGWKEISRRYNFNDLSWLYDINFELLKKHDIEKVICVGLQQFDIATRIKLAGIDPKKIVCFKYLEDATYYLKIKTKHNIYAILNFDYVKPFISYMKGEKND